MSIKKRFMTAYLSAIIITASSILLIMGVIFYSTLGEVPSIKKIYQMLTTQRSLNEDERMSFELMSNYVNKSPDLLEYPFNKDILDMINTIESKNLSIALRKNNSFTYYSDDLKESSLVFHAPEYDFYNYEPTGTIDNDGRFFHYIKTDFKYLDGSSGSSIILKRESTLFEFFVKWGIGIILSILLLALILYWIITKQLEKTVIKPIINLEEKTRSLVSANGKTIVPNFDSNHKASKEIDDLQESFKNMATDLLESQEKQALYQSNRNRLISDISHDLKTPLTSIIGYVEGLLDGVAKSEEQQDLYLNTVYEKSIMLNDLVDQLFAYSNIDFESIDSKKQHINLIDFIDSFISNSKSNEDLSMHFETSINAAGINMNMTELQRVFNNLLENSIKFKKEGQTQVIDISLLENHTHYIISFKDYGVGISEDDLEHVFERFFRSDKSRTSQIKGNGLGLSIVEKIIEKHSGTINIESIENESTTISFSIKKEEEE